MFLLDWWAKNVSSKTIFTGWFPDSQSRGRVFSPWDTFTAWYFYAIHCGSWAMSLPHHLTLLSFQARIREFISAERVKRDRCSPGDPCQQEKDLRCCILRRELEGQHFFIPSSGSEATNPPFHPPTALISTLPPVPSGKSQLELVNWQTEQESEKKKWSKQDSEGEVKW